MNKLYDDDQLANYQDNLLNYLFRKHWRMNKIMSYSLGCRCPLLVALFRGLYCLGLGCPRLVALLSGWPCPGLGCPRLSVLLRGFSSAGPGCPRLSVLLCYIQKYSVQVGVCGCFEIHKSNSITHSIVFTMLFAN